MTQRGLDITDFTERGSLSSQSFSGRSVGVLVFSERGEGVPVSFTPRTLGTTTFSERGKVPSDPIIPPWDDPDDDFPEISNVHCNSLNPTSVELDWDTNEPANCQVRYSVSTAMTTYTEGVQHEHYVVSNRSYWLTGLSADTDYYFRIVAYDRTGNGVISTKYTFKTADVGKAGAPPQPYVSP